MSVDEDCKLVGGRLFKDFHCFLKLVDNKSDKFYVIQLLHVTDEYFVYTRWGKNGTSGQNKLEGPMELARAEKLFKIKFKEKTKNNWDDRDCFVPAKNKYKMVTGKADHQSSEYKKPNFPDTSISGIILPADILYQIMLCVTTRDVLRCMQVCKHWKMSLSEKYFWKKFIYNHFDLTLTTDFQDEYPFCQWMSVDNNPGCFDWFCYYDDESDPYVIRPFPSIWGCRVVHPFGLDPLDGDLKSLQGFSRSLEILTHMRNKARLFEIASGNQCSGNEGCDDICVVLFPWKKKRLPDANTVLTKIFHFHPEICEISKNAGEKITQKLFYHMPQDEEDEDYDEELEDHKEPCLNRIFGLIKPGEESNHWRQDVEEFYKWLQNIMVPTLTVYAGVDKLNPVVVFFVTNLAPGWVGGVLTGVNYT